MPNVTNGPRGQTLAGTVSADELKGGAGSDLISGLDGRDFIYGGGGNDTLDGGSGDDWLYGGAGADQLTGGAGADTFVIDGRLGATLDDVDHVVDFTHGEDRLGFSDRISLAGRLMSTGTATTYDEALTSARGLIGSGSANVVAIQLGADVVVFAGADLHTRVDAAVVLVGKTLSGIDNWDIY
jgi:Ca2+-binding RTX toxin-like protein